jgi:hypothetical protein
MKISPKFPPLLFPLLSLFFQFFLVAKTGNVCLGGLLGMMVGVSAGPIGITIGQIIGLLIEFLIRNL